MNIRVASSVTRYWSSNVLVTKPRRTRVWRRSVKLDVADAEGRADGAAGLEDGQESIVFTPKDKTATEYQFLKPVLKELLHTLHAKHDTQSFSFSQGYTDAGLPKTTFTDRLQTLVRRGLLTKTIDDLYRLTDEATRLFTVT